jgi:hypothetical protein
MPLHDALTYVIFVGGAIALLLWMGFSFARKKIKGILGLVYLISAIIFAINQWSLFEWISLWILCVWTILKNTKEMIKNE